MKLKPLLLFAIMLISSVTFAQNASYNKGDNLFNIGIGIGSPFFGSGYSSSLPVNPSVSFEHCVTDAISIGGQVSYASSKYSYHDVLYGGNSYEYKENAIYAGARASYHLNEAFNLDDKWDLYGGASLGYVIVSASDNAGFSAASASAVGFGLYGGGKFHFSKGTGIYAELGYQSLALLNVGLSFKF